MKDLELIKAIVRAERPLNIEERRRAFEAWQEAQRASLDSVREQFMLGTLS